MVVATRTPAPAVASRSNSTQAIPRKKKHAPAPPKDNGTRLDASPTKTPPRQPTRRAEKKQRKPRTLGFFDRLFLLSLLGFVVYAATVCTSSTTRSLALHEQPIACRALATYRTSILEPYIVPPLKIAYSHTLGHPQVQEQIAPHLAKVQEHLKPVVDAAKEVNERAIQPTTRIVYGVVWKGYVLPWYRRAFLPRYNQYVAPRLQAGWELGVKAPLRPYIVLAKGHARNAQLYVHKHVIHKVKAWWHTVYPQLVQVQEKVQPALIQAQETVQPALVSAYEKAQPLASTALVKATEVAQVAWQQSRPYVLQALQTIRLYLGIALKEGGKARRTYVDPHVRKILDKVSSETSVRAEQTRNILEDELYDDAGFQVLEALTAEPTLATADEPTPIELAPEPSAEVEVTAATPDVLETAPPTPTPVEHVPEEASPLDEPASTIEAGEAAALKSAVSVAEQSAEAPTASIGGDASKAEPSGPAQNLEEGVYEKMAHAVEDKVEQAASGSVTSAPAASETKASHATIIDDDFDDFLSDLGIDSESVKEAKAFQGAADAQQTLVAEETTPELSEEEQAERMKEEVAAKRSNILKRHHEWRQKLDALVEEQKLKVVEGVDEARKTAAAELNAKDGLGRKSMGSVEKQGEKLMKGLETYLNKAEGRSDTWKTGTDEQAQKDRSAKEKQKWQDVLAKVDARFDAVVKGIQAEVHEWYTSIRNKERQVALDAAAPIKDLAETAQSDLAMDYAWLEDVTYKDWQNYHDLVRTYENFEKEAANGVQDSTSAQPQTVVSWLTLISPDPLVVALDELQRELDDIVAGFKYAISALKSRATSILAISDADAESEGTFAIKRQKGELVDDMRGVPGYEPTPAVPAAETATILPISPPGTGTGEAAPGSEDEQKVADAAYLFVGKAKVQVEEAIGRAAGEL